MAMSQERQPLDWEAVYHSAPAEAMPWHYPNLDPDTGWALNMLDARVPSVLDLGTGCGDQAIEVARRGLDVTGTDISGAAIAEATKRAAAKGIRVRFVQDDILKTRLNRTFDFIIDRGCLHCLPSDRRQDYVAIVTRLLRWRGHLLLKCFSHLAPEGSDLPHRFTPQEVVEIFKQSPLQICDIRASVYYGTMEPAPSALFCVLRRD